MYLSTNIRFLRKQKKLTQEQFAIKIGVKRSLIGAYEEGRAEPKLSTILNICSYFKISLDDLIQGNLSDKPFNEVSKEKIRGDGMRILPIAVSEDDESKELATLVPVKAAAGYLDGYGDVDFIQELPKFSFPFTELPQDRTYRVFQIQGDSMLPVEEGSYIIGEYLLDWNRVKSDDTYIIVSKDEGIVYKRVLNDITNNQLILKSDNKVYDPYPMELENVAEIWKAHGYVTFKLPDDAKEESSNDVGQLAQMIGKLQKEISQIKSQIE
jgi:transcriptional regulator with XRE-family HTH domain